MDYRGVLCLMIVMGVAVGSIQLLSMIPLHLDESSDPHIRHFVDQIIATVELAIGEEKPE